MKYCIRCAREIGEGHIFCPYCGSSQKDSRKVDADQIQHNDQSKLTVVKWVVIAFFALLVLAALLEKIGSNSSMARKTETSLSQEKSFSGNVVSVTAKQILNEFKNNEIRAGDRYNGRRVLIAGCAADIDNSFGVLSVFINSCGGIMDLDFVHAQFSDNEKNKLSRLNKGQRISVECTIIDGGNIMGVSANNCNIK